MDDQNTIARARSFDRDREITEPWAIELARGTNLRWLGNVRGISDVRTLDSGEAIWLRGRDISSETWAALAAIPDAVHYRVLPDEQLALVGRIVPSNQLPQGSWAPLRDWLSVELPTSRFAGVVRQQLPIRLVRSSRPKQANVMQCEFEVWSDYALTAVRLRLKPLRFACSEKGRVLIHGHPLPPIRGTLWYEIDGVAIPSGYRWEPEIDVAVLKQLLLRTTVSSEVRPGLFLLRPEASSEGTTVAVETVSEDNTVPATYASVRATRAKLAEASQS